MNARKLLLALGATTAVGAAGLGVGAALEDPEPSVEPIALSAVQGGQTEQDEPGAAPANRQVAALDEVSGTVTRDDDDDRDDVDDFDDLEIGRVDLDFGPDSWVRTAGPMEDYDGDGTAEDLRAELEGLVGTEARLLVRLDADGDDADVYVINDLPFREVGAPAPWQAADALPEDEIRAAAAAAVGEGAEVKELDAEDGTAVAWEAEVVDAEGREYDVLLDAAGNVIDVRLD